MKTLGRYYVGYASAVGGLLFLLMLVATQAARSTAEAVAAILLGLVGPAPMLLVGLALRRGLKRALVLAVVLPIAMGLLVASVAGKPQPPRAAGVVVSAVFNAAWSQTYFLPGAVVLGALAAAHAIRNRGKCRQPAVE